MFAAGGRSLFVFLAGSVLLAASIARADVAFDLVAVPGDGYSVFDDGKAVQLTGAVPSEIDFELRAVFSGYKAGDATGLLLDYGTILSGQIGGGLLQQGSLTAANRPDFRFSAFSNGRSQDINGDGVGDIGPVGTLAEGSTLAWAGQASASSSDWLAPSQSPFNRLEAPGAPGNQVLANLKLQGIALNSTAGAGASTAFNYVPRLGSSCHISIESGAPQHSFTVGRPVEVLAPGAAPRVGDGTINWGAMQAPSPPPAPVPPPAPATPPTPATPPAPPAAPSTPANTDPPPAVPPTTPASPPTTPAPSADPGTGQAGSSGTLSVDTGGTISKQGSGTLTLSGGTLIQPFSGGTINVQGGSGVSGTITIGNGSTMSNATWIALPVSEGTLSLPSSAGTISVQTGSGTARLFIPSGTLTIGNGSTWKIDTDTVLLSGTTTIGTGPIVLQGGTLETSLTPGTKSIASPWLGGVVPIIQNGNPAFPESGEGTLLITNGYEIGPLDIGPDRSLGAHVGFPAGTDYSQWLNGLITLGFYQDSASIPEPSTLVLLAVGMLAIFWRLRRR